VIELLYTPSLTPLPQCIQRQ